MDIRLGLKMFGKRFCAYMIDVIIVTIFCTLLSFVFSLVGFENLFYRSLVFYAIGIAYFSIQESSSYQATLGKRAFGLVVCTKEGDPISILRAVARNVLRLVNMVVFSLGYVFIIFTANQQGLHDLIAKTLVVNEEDFSEEDEDEEYDEEE